LYLSPSTDLSSFLVKSSDELALTPLGLKHPCGFRIYFRLESQLILSVLASIILTFRGWRLLLRLSCLALPIQAQVVEPLMKAGDVLFAREIP
jgi:hypothetical protein